MINPRCLCRKHLLGEHGEIHKHIPSFRKGHRINGRFSPIVQIQLNALRSRHDELAEEMIRRGMNHRSPLNDLPDLKEIYPEYYYLNVNIENSILDLSSRCESCRSLIYQESKFEMRVKT